MSTISIIPELLIADNPAQIERVNNIDFDVVLKTICAFLNTNGGWLLLGPLGEDNTEEQLIEIVNNLLTNALERITPQPLLDAKVEKAKDKFYILVNVVRGSRQPYAFDKRYFVRDASVTRTANEDDISILLRTSDSFVSSWEKMMVFEAEVLDLNRDEIKSTIIASKNNGRGRTLPDDPFNFLSYFQMVDGERIRNSAMVLFGREPIKFLPQARIRLHNMPRGVTADTYANSKLIESNLLVAYEQVISFLESWIPTRSKFSNEKGDREDRLAIPFEALDEAVVNALVHRDYGNLSGEIVINVCPEYVEIINPGEMPNNVVVMKTKVQPHHSIFRNPTIAHMFFLRDRMEKVGRGLALISETTTQSGLRSPEWICENGFTVLTLYMTDAVFELNDRAFQFLSGLSNGDEFVTKTYLSSFEGTISERTARNDINVMLDGKWIEKTGDSRQTRYIRTNKVLPHT